MRRLVFAEGHDPRVLQVIARMTEERAAVSIAVGQHSDITRQIARAGLDLKQGPYFEIAEPDDHSQFFDQWLAFQSAKLMRSNVTNLPAFMRESRNTASAARLVAAQQADCLLCGLSGDFPWHFVQIRENITALQRDVAGFLRLLVKPERVLGLVHCASEGSSTDIAQLTVNAIRQARTLNLAPSIMLCQDSHWKNVVSQAEALSRAGSTVKALVPDVDVQAPVDLWQAVRISQSTDHTSKTDCTILILPGSATAQMVADALLSTSDWRDVGPFLLGTNNQAHILNPYTSVDGLVEFSGYLLTAVQPARVGNVNN